MSTSINPPLKWHGGKHYLTKHIISLMQPHLHYVEPYFGGGQVLFARDRDDRQLWWPKQTSDGRTPDGVSEVINDLHGDLINFYAVLKNPQTFTQLRQRLELTLHSEREWEAASDLLGGKDGDPVERACALFTCCRQSLSGRMTSFAPTVRTRLRGGRNDGVNGWWNAVEGLHAVHARLADVKVLNRPALDVIRTEDTEATLFYLDPPYLHETRAATDVYAHEMSRADHVELLQTLRGVKGCAILSGYRSPLYDDTLTDWRRVEVERPNNAAGGAAKRRMTECIWINRSTV
jgi:DNA adenine methylase